MINSYYTEELDLLRQIARDFSNDNPAIAPMLGEPCADPDVERLLEGVAFLTGCIRQKIDDEFPEIVHDLLRQIWPNALRPLPSATLLAFSPIHKLTETRKVPAGAFALTSQEQGMACQFRTCTDVDVHPMCIRDAVYMTPPGKPPWIRVQFALSVMGVARFKPGKLKLYLGGNYKEASDLYHLLSTHVKEIVIQAEGDENAFHLGPECLVAKGFDSDEALIPWPTHAFEGFRLIQEFFLMPEKYLFFELSGIDSWNTSSNANEFHVDFILDKSFEEVVKCSERSFVLFVTPAINVFPHASHPVISDHRKTEYPVRPAGVPVGPLQIYSIEKVTGFYSEKASGITFSEYHTYLTGDSPYYYRERLSKHPVNNQVDVSVSIAYSRSKALPPVKSLSFDLLCTNGELAENFAEGAICFTGETTPEGIDVKNIRKPTVSALPPLGSQALWRLTSLLAMNILSLKRTEDLKSLLGLFVMEGYRDRHHVRTNEHKIKGIKGFETKSVDRLIGGALVRGLDMRITLSRSHFAGMGDVYLFGTVLSHFFGMYATINTFTRLTINETDSGEILEWKERMGRDLL